LFPNIATPITYELDGRQYISVLSGNGSANSLPARMYTFALDGKLPMPAAPPPAPAGGRGRGGQRGGQQ
jgi:hypothetical protein